MHGGPSRSWVVPVLMKYTSLKNKALYQRIEWSYLDPNAELLTASLDEQQDWYVKNGAMKKKLNTDKMIDSRFIEYAVGRLGRAAVK
jgi:NitT/TauT family transport system substrate-binding protein